MIDGRGGGIEWGRRTMLACALALVGCAIVVGSGWLVDPTTTPGMIGTLLGLYVIFVGLAGLVHAVRTGTGAPALDPERDVDLGTPREGD